MKKIIAIVGLTLASSVALACGDISCYQEGSWGLMQYSGGGMSEAMALGDNTATQASSAGLFVLNTDFSNFGYAGDGSGGSLMGGWQAMGESSGPDNSGAFAGGLSSGVFEFSSEGGDWWTVD